MYRSSFGTAPRILALALLVLGGCTSDSLTAPELTPNLSRRSESDDRPTRVVMCPTTQSYRTSGMLGPEGGTLQVGGHRLTVPAGVLTEMTRFTLRAPAGPEVKLELYAGGARHYQFSSPVAVTISYDRCTRQHQPRAAVTAWYVDDGGQEFIERMGGRDDRNRMEITFQTSHFSTYLVAY
jgi:hypothetical protein